jgi:hypothetical protein
LTATTAATSGTALLSGHRAQTIRRLAREKTARIIQDTADLSFSTRKHCLDLGRIGKNQTSTESMGLKMHSAMAVTTETEYPGTNLRVVYKLVVPHLQQPRRARRHVRRGAGAREGLSGQGGVARTDEGGKAERRGPRR